MFCSILELGERVTEYCRDLEEGSKLNKGISMERVIFYFSFFRISRDVKHDGKEGR